ncbi:MAG TPA: hypothetical protein DDY13_09605 [Cytophagales bacterium]|jgi:nitrate/TMAO reductase-like tetraheme cytochrome c subunit|nr:hypothetical protein [Cytophagales bacterium]
MIEETKDLVKILTTVLVIIDFALIIYLIRKRGILDSKVKKVILFGVIIIPFGVAFLANYHVFETSKTIGSCQNCHVMKPFTNDMQNPASMTLAARHYKNNWIAKDQCYACHADYGFNGTLKAKTDGYRHLMRYITRTYHEPIRYRGGFNNQNCLNCHENASGYLAVEMHEPLREDFKSNETSCLNCHGRAHPKPSSRTPGHEDYQKLISEFELLKEPKNRVEEVADFLLTLNDDENEEF